MAPTYNYQASHLQSFQHARKAGEEFEQKVIKLLKKAGHEAWKSKDRSYDLDVALDVPEPNLRRYANYYNITFQKKQYERETHDLEPVCRSAKTGRERRTIWPKNA